MRYCMADTIDEAGGVGLQVGMALASPLMSARERMTKEVVVIVEAWRSSKRHSISLSWYDQVLNHRLEARLDVISRLHKLIVHLKDECQEISNKALTVSVASRIEGSDEILARNAYFVREDAGKSESTEWKCQAVLIFPVFG